MMKLRVFTSWDWLKGFGYFLLCWPILCVSTVLEELYKEPDWSLIIGVVFGPAILGTLLLIIEFALTRLYGERLYHSAIPVPNALRDLSNCFWTLLVVLLLFISVYLGEGESLKRLTSMVKPLLMFTGCALGLRFLSRLIYGKPRCGSLGSTWRERSGLPRLLGYLGMMPLLILIPVVLIDMIEEPHLLIKHQFLVMMFSLWLCLRGVMAYPAGAWASHPWEYELRLWSLSVPWILIMVLSLFGFGGLMMTLPFLDDGSIDHTVDRVLMWLFLFPLGGFSVYIGYRFTRFLYPKYSSTFRFMKTLTSTPDVLVQWQVVNTIIQGKYGENIESATVYIELSDGQEWSRSFDESEYPLRQFLRQTYPKQENSYIKVSPEEGADMLQSQHSAG